jgi:hypothetical protein
MPVRVCPYCREEIATHEWNAHVGSHRRNGSPPGWRNRRNRVIARDGGRCTFVDPYGRRCPETTQLEVHHVDGDWRHDDEDNLATRCAGHNPRDPTAYKWAKDMLPNQHQTRPRRE